VFVHIDARTSTETYRSIEQSLAARDEAQHPPEHLIGAGPIMANDDDDLGGLGLPIPSSGRSRSMCLAWPWRLPSRGTD